MISQSEYFVITIDFGKCTGCRLCELVCSLQNSGEINPGRSSIRLITLEDDVISRCTPVVCMQCEEATCETVCPAEAIKRAGKPPVMKVEEKECFGCKICVYACPFNALYTDSITGKVLRCTHCEGEPQCVKICPFGALNYVRNDKASIQLKRSGMLSVLNLKNRA